LAVAAFFSPELVAVRFASGDPSADDSHGGKHVFAAMDDADGRGSESKKNDDVDALDVYLHVRVVSRGIDRLLAG